jgi:signal transduction histidine kinase
VNRISIAIALVTSFVAGWLWIRKLRQLGNACDAMTRQLAELQEDLRREERDAMVGRIALSLVHDLSHPIQNIGNSSRLILKMWDDPEYRESFRRTIDREQAQITRILDDLRNVAQPMPLERFPIDVNKSVAELVDSMRTTASSAGLSLTTELSAEPVFVDADVCALNRIYGNLITNAVQATPPCGRVIVRTRIQDHHALIEVADTGWGIPPERLETIFDDFVTTKRRGLGVGLSTSRRAVEQLGGTMLVTSQLGAGSMFTLRFPLTAARPAGAATA